MNTFLYVTREIFYLNTFIKWSEKSKFKINFQKKEWRKKMLNDTKLILETVINTSLYWFLFSLFLKVLRINIMQQLLLSQFQ